MLRLLFYLLRGSKDNMSSMLILFANGQDYNAKDEFKAGAFLDGNTTTNNIKQQHNKQQHSSNIQKQQQTRTQDKDQPSTGLGSNSALRVFVLLALLV